MTPSINKKNKMEKKLFTGKFESINGSWYPVSVSHYTLKEAIKCLYKGQRKSYGTVQAVKGRFILND